MSLTLFLFIGFLGVFLIMFIKRPLMDMLGENNKLVHKLKNAIWFQNHWLSGIFLFVIFIYWLVILKPSYPGEDTFMRAIGLVLGIIVTTVACISCFIITGYSNKKAVN